MRDITDRFGSSAGEIWSILNTKGPLTRSEIIEITKLDENDFYSGIGWLAREDKISVDNNKSYSLAPTNLTKTIGTTAGRVWKILDIWEEADIQSIQRLADVDESDIHTAIGWLAREDKIKINEKQKFNLK